MKTLKTLIAIFILLHLLPTYPQLFATHFLGSEITYRCTGNPNEYIFKFKTCRDCSGATSITNNLIFDVISGGCGAVVPVTPWSAQVTTEITPLCQGIESNCTAAGSFVSGIQQYEWERTYFLPPGCIWSISYSTCCRSGALTNIQGNTEYFIKILVNDTFSSCNSSPEFLSPFNVYGCTGEWVFYNPAAVDMDGDSLVFSLVDCRINYNSCYIQRWVKRCQSCKHRLNGAYYY